MFVCVVAAGLLPSFCFQLSHVNVAILGAIVAIRFTHETSLPILIIVMLSQLGFSYFVVLLTMSVVSLTIFRVSYSSAAVLAELFSNCFSMCFH